MQTKIYQSGSGNIKFKDIVKEMFLDLIASKNLAWRLTVRDIRAQYRQSILGILWAFINPIMNTLVWIFLNASGAVSIADTGIPYPVYVFTGTMLWDILMQSIGMPMQQTQASKGIMGKINFPKEALLLSGVYKIIFDTIIKLIILLVALVAMGVLPTIQMILLPFIFAGIILVGFAIGTLLTPVGMLYTDIGRAVPLAMSLLRYTSPVVYAVTGTGILAQIVRINPFTPLITMGRSALTGLPFVDTQYFLIVCACALVLFFFSWFFYRFSIPIIVERGSGG